MAANLALTAMINEEFAPALVGEDPRDITRLWEQLYNGSRAHYALRKGRVFPVLGRRGITISELSGSIGILTRSRSAPFQSVTPSQAGHSAPFKHFGNVTPCSVLTDEKGKKPQCFCWLWHCDVLKWGP
jgi:hypothetical protein